MAISSVEFFQELPHFARNPDAVLACGQRLLSLLHYHRKDRDTEERKPEHHVSRKRT